jgi:sulfatase modifying factor 1
MKQAIIIIGLIILTGCYHYRHRLTEDKIESGTEPPGCIQIDNNFYCDRHEITNIDYLEYLYWLERVFGGKSDEYLNAIPDTNCWNKAFQCPAFYPVYNLYYPFYYLRHPISHEDPIIGVTQQQARDYCKWRSDRVFELTLVDLGYIELNVLQNDSNYFTIEKYLHGEYKTRSGQGKILIYPEYTLPTLVERKKNIGLQ